MTIYSLYIYKTILFTKKRGGIQKTYQWNTRSKYDYYRNRVNKNFSENNPYIKGVIFFNKLPNEIKKLEGKIFKRKFKKYLIQQVLYSIQEY